MLLLHNGYICVNENQLQSMNNASDLNFGINWMCDRVESVNKQAEGR